MSSSDVAFCPSEYKKSEGYEKSLQVIALFRQRQAALIKMFLLLFTDITFVAICTTEDNLPLNVFPKYHGVIVKNNVYSDAIFILVPMSKSITRTNI